MMSDLVERIYDENGRKLSIVGWSLGGVFARELAKMHPDIVRSVISLGSPISNNRRHAAPSRIFEAINGKQTQPEEEGRYLDLGAAPPVPAKTCDPPTCMSCFVIWPARRTVFGPCRMVSLRRPTG